MATWMSRVISICLPLAAAQEALATATNAGQDSVTTTASVMLTSSKTGGEPATPAPKSSPTVALAAARCAKHAKRVTASSMVSAHS